MPGKKILLILVACIIAVGGIYLSSKHPATQTYTAKIKASPQVLVSDAIKADADKDTDGDGLKDWEEILWKMNPLSGDTDKDGVSDVKEVELQKISKNSEVIYKNTQKTATKITENLTQTDTFARDFFTTYAEYKKSGVPIIGNTEQQQQIVNSILNKSAIEDKIKQFTLANIKINDNDSEESIKQYGNTLGTILINNSPKKEELENEFVIFSKAIQNQNAKELEKLDIIIKSYKNIITEFSTVAVPKSAAQTHLNLLNTLNAVLASDQGMRIYFDDPIGGLSGYVYYKKRVGDLHKALADTVSYFNEKNVVFGEEEGGFVLVHSI